MSMVECAECGAWVDPEGDAHNIEYGPRLRYTKWLCDRCMEEEEMEREIEAYEYDRAFASAEREGA